MEDKPGQYVISSIIIFSIAAISCSYLVNILLKNSKSFKGFCMILFGNPIESESTSRIVTHRIFHFLVFQFTAFYLFLLTILNRNIFVYTFYFGSSVYLIRRFPPKKWSIWAILLVLFASASLCFAILQSWYNYQEALYSNVVIDNVESSLKDIDNNVVLNVEENEYEVDASSTQAEISSTSEKNFFISIISEVFSFLQNLVFSTNFSMNSSPWHLFAISSFYISLIYSVFSAFRGFKNSFVPKTCDSMFTLYYYRNIFTAGLLTYLYAYFFQLPEIYESALSAKQFGVTILIIMCVSPINVDSASSESSKTLITRHLRSIVINFIGFSDSFDALLEFFGVLIVNVFTDAIASACTLALKGLFFFAINIFTCYVYSQYLSIPDSERLFDIVVPFGLIFVSIFYTNKLLNIPNEYTFYGLATSIIVFFVAHVMESDVFSLRLPVESETEAYVIMLFKSFMTWMADVEYYSDTDNAIYLISTAFKMLVVAIAYEMIFLLNYRILLAFMLMPINVSKLLTRLKLSMPHLNNNIKGFLYLIDVKNGPSIISEVAANLKSSAVPYDLPGLPRWQNIIFRARENMFKHHEKCMKEAKQRSPYPFFSIFTDENNWFNIGSAWHQVYSNAILDSYKVDDIITSHILVDFAKLSIFPGSRKKQLFKEMDQYRLKNDSNSQKRAMEDHAEHLIRAVNNIVEKAIFQLQFISTFIQLELLSEDPSTGYAAVQNSSSRIIDRGRGFQLNNTSISIMLNPYSANIPNPNNRTLNSDNTINVIFMPEQLIEEIQAKDKFNDNNISQAIRNKIKESVLFTPFTQKYLGFLVKGFYGDLVGAVSNPFPSQRAENIILAIESLSHLLTSSQLESRSNSFLDFLPLVLQSLISFEVTIIQYLCHFCFFVEDFVSGAHNFDAGVDVDVAQLRANAKQSILRNPGAPALWEGGISFRFGNQYLLPAVKHFISNRGYKLNQVYNDCVSLSQLAFDDNITKNPSIRAISAAIDEALNRLLIDFGDRIYKDYDIPLVCRLRLEKRRKILSP